MSFWSSVKNIATKLSDKAQNFTQELNAHKDNFRNKDNEYLVQKAKKSSGVEKMAAIQILKERGYGKTVDDE